MTSEASSTPRKPDVSERDVPASVLGNQDTPTPGPKPQGSRSETFNPTPMSLVSVELRQANEFVERLHRHHKRIQGRRFSIGAVKNGELVGVAIVGRPVGGANQDRWVEVTRCCTDGTRNACSFLYGAAARAAKELGYERIQTYILSQELGTSLIASGWTFERMSHPVGWHHDGPRAARHVEEHLTERKQLWFKTLSTPKPAWEIPDQLETESDQLILEAVSGL